MKASKHQRNNPGFVQCLLRRLFISMLWFLPVASIAQIADVEAYLNEKDDKGLPLKVHIASFSQYGDRSDTKNIRVIVVGGVLRPGVYYVPKGTNLLDLIQRAGKLETVPGQSVVSYTNRVPIFRTGEEGKTISFFDKDGKPINKDFKLIDGDVIKVRAVVL
jgi:hypothetical protein